MDLIIKQDGMSEVQVKRSTENLEAMADFFGDSVDSITVSAPNPSDESFLFKKGKKSLTFRCKGDRFSGGYLVIEIPNKKKEKESRVKVL